ncbi:L-rhamnose isomerase [Acinetobacter baumannii]|uniref:L-rhamnose isomerase n=1 Tax=Acinetobacter baumannii TaxID=470 RepID=UPI003D3015D2
MTVSRRASACWNALDEVISEKLDPAHHIDAVESKLFGIGAKATPSAPMSSIWATPPAVRPRCAWMPGHFHPTEVISDKISAAMLYMPRLLLHVSRPVRWDSDHVVLLDDETQAIASEIIRHNLFDRVHIGLDFFDASINRIAAWVIGTRNMKKRYCAPCWNRQISCVKLENDGDYTARLALLEEQNLCHGRPSGKCIASVTTRRLAASGWTAYALMKKRLRNVADRVT